MFAVCLDRATGKIVHDVKVFDTPKPEHIADVNSYASPTPAIEAGRVYVHYGTYGTACLDTQTGQVLWTRRDLNCDHHEGPGSSPILFENLLIVHVDGRDVQYVVALDKQTGQTVWKTNRSIDYSPLSLQPAQGVLHADGHRVRRAAAADQPRGEGGDGLRSADGRGTVEGPLQRLVDGRRGRCSATAWCSWSTTTSGPSCGPSGRTARAT